MSASSSRRPEVLALLALVACGDASHIYEGRLFVEERRCLGTTSSLDVVEGERPGQCAPVCLVQPQRDGGRAVYVSTMCGPYPFGFRVTNEPPCDEALAALGRNETCTAR